MKAIPCSVYDFEKEIHKHSSFTYVRKNIWEPMNIEIRFNIAAVGLTTKPYLIFQNDTSVMHIHSIKRVVKYIDKNSVRYKFHCNTESYVDKNASNTFEIICS